MMDLEILMILFKIVFVVWALGDMLEFIAEVIFDLGGGVKNKLLRLGVSILTYLLSCNKCLTFWTTLIITGDIFISALASVIIRLVNWIWGLIPIKKETKL